MAKLKIKAVKGKKRSKRRPPKKKKQGLARRAAGTVAGAGTAATVGMAHGMVKAGVSRKAAGRVRVGAMVTGFAGDVMLDHETAPILKRMSQGALDSGVSLETSQRGEDLINAWLEHREEEAEERDRERGAAQQSELEQLFERMERENAARDRRLEERERQTRADLARLVQSEMGNVRRQLLIDMGVDVEELESQQEVVEVPAHHARSRGVTAQVGALHG